MEKALKVGYTSFTARKVSAAWRPLFERSAQSEATLQYSHGDTNIWSSLQIITGSGVMLQVGFVFKLH